MSNFSTPFANSAERRLANADEKANGFPCGPADQKLFNGLIHQFQKELDAIHQAGGVAGDDSTFNTTLLNIQALIDAATGGGEGAGYLLMSQARTRNPVFPIIDTADFKINCSSPGAGTVRIPGGVSFLHRGIYIEETVETDFATLANKTYHLRWSYADGYELKDLADVTYNPTTAAETSSIFDSTFDDMLIARVITNSSNVATITNLANAVDLSGSFTKATIETQPTSWSGLPFLTASINWARTPRIISVSNQNTDATSGTESVVGLDSTRSRYTVTAMARGYVIGLPSGGDSYISGSVSIDVIA
jgi:hypothetical protein